MCESVRGHTVFVVNSNQPGLDSHIAIILLSTIEQL